MHQGLHDVGKLKAGETLLVSGAAGAVGSLVCQLGKRAGAKVVALAGSDDKCAWLENELGVDVALNYKRSTFKEDFKNAVGYLDVFFDNVGGEILDLALKYLNKDARIALCGPCSFPCVKPGFADDVIPGAISAYSRLTMLTSLGGSTYPSSRFTNASWPSKLYEYHRSASQDPRFYCVRSFVFHISRCATHFA